MTENMLALIIIAQLTILVFMIIIFALYLRLNRMMNAYIASNDRVIASEEERVSLAFEALELLMKYFGGVSQECEDIQAKSKEILSIAEDKAQHARLTMQEARRMLTKENNVAPEDVKEEKGEENNE